MVSTNAHYFDCHPDEEDVPVKDYVYQPLDIEDCAHCGTAVRKGCWCYQCTTADRLADNQLVYHCPRCNRVWAYVYEPVITKIAYRDRDGRRTTVPLLDMGPSANEDR